MKSLVTGCAGFIGSHLVERLIEEGHSVVGIDSFMDYYPRQVKEDNIRDALRNNNFRFIAKDILELNMGDILKDIDYVFHQAAQAGVRFSWGKNFNIYTRNNILVTQRILEACKKSAIKKVIYASSSSVYGDALSLPMKENDVPKPVSPYGVSKLAAEHLCYLYYKNYQVPSISLRYFTVYGPRQRPDMAFHKFIKAVLEGGEIEIYSNGEQTRDFTFISDIIDANILAMNSEMDNSEIFNVGGGSRKTLNEVIGIIEDIMGKKTKTTHIKKQKGDMRHTYADISKAKERLQYIPQVGLEEGLRKEVLWLEEFLNRK